MGKEFQWISTTRPDFVRWLNPKPAHLHSPTHVLHAQRGNSFELANILVCLLLGLGYNAYVASGYASREQARCDQTKKTCPYLPKPEVAPTANPPVDTSKYRPRTPPDFRSRFIEDMQERKRKKEEEEREQREEEERRIIAELERPSADRLFGQRIHAWVLLLPGGLGPRGPEITEPLFVETTTAESHSPSELETANLYQGIESVWNNRNYWVNMQDCSEACAKLDWNLGDPKLWEHLLAGEPRELRDVEDDEDPEVNLRRDFHMVMPASYVDKIEIPYEAYERRYPNGRKTIYFKKTKVELFAPYLRTDGMIESVTKFEDYEYMFPTYIYQKYKYRGDHLIRTEKDLQKESIIDFYTKGRPDNVNTHRYFMNSRDVVDEERTLEYHENKRLDELYCFKMHLLYSSQDFRNRKDRLYNRFVEYSAFNNDNNQDIHYRTILKISERFHRNEAAPACKDVALREFDFVENEIRLTYHYSDGEYTQATRCFKKPPVTERGDRLVYLPEMTHSYNPDPMASPDDFADLIDELEKQLIEEDASMVLARQAESEIHDFLQVRANEYSAPKMLISLYDPIRNNDLRTDLREMEEKIRAQGKREVENEADFMSPYMARLGDVQYLTQKQALQARDDCVNDFKQSMVDRANGMMRDFENRSKELQRLQSALTQSEGLNKEEKEEILKKINEADLTLRALEVRLNRHRDLAPGRHRKLVELLRQNPRISILYDE